MDDDDRIIQEILASGKWSEEAVRISLRANFKCEYCGFDFYASPEAYKEWEREHIVPLSSGGTQDFDNLALACRTCNYCFKSKWDPRNYAGENATRAELIAAAKRYIRERKQLTQQQIAVERAIIEKGGRRL
jgi:5-methylcytosine-specific restriction endonuclease McrA